MARTKYKVTNYGNTRTIFVKGKSWEISKGATISFDDKKVPEAEEVAEAFRRLQFVDVSVEVIKQPVRKKEKAAKKVATKKKAAKKKTKKKKVTAKKKKSKKIKRRKK